MYLNKAGDIENLNYLRTSGGIAGDIAEVEVTIVQEVGKGPVPDLLEPIKLVDGQIPEEVVSKEVKSEAVLPDLLTTSHTEGKVIPPEVRSVHCTRANYVFISWRRWFRVVVVVLFIRFFQLQYAGIHIYFLLIFKTKFCNINCKLLLHSLAYNNCNCFRFKGYIQGIWKWV